MKKVIEDCIGLLMEDDKKKHNEKKENENYDIKNEGNKDKGGFVIKKTVKESEKDVFGSMHNPLLKKN